MSGDSPDRQQLLEEVRRRAGRRRQRRHRVLAGGSVLTVIAVVALAVHLSAAPGGAKKVQILAPPGGATTSTAVSAPPTTTVLPSTTIVSVPSSSASPSASESVILPVVVCPTTFGISPSPAPAVLPASMKVTVPASLATSLAVYRDNQGTMEVLAPGGWACMAGYGADGSGGVAVYPAGQSLPASWAAGWKLSPSSAVEAITGVETSACQGCTNGQACPLFTAAASAFLAQLGHTCPDVRPVSETVHQVSAGVVGFQDPPGVSGDGLPSGGQDPANGVMTYYPGNPNGSWLETCTLPSGAKDVCTAVLDQFLTGYGHD
jgi:hypothetical protein